MNHHSLYQRREAQGYQHPRSVCRSKQEIDLMRNNDNDDKDEPSIPVPACQTIIKAGGLIFLPVFQGIALLSLLLSLSKCACMSHIINSPNLIPVVNVARP